MIEIYSFIQPIFNEQLLWAEKIIFGILWAHAAISGIVQWREEKEDRWAIIKKWLQIGRAGVKEMWKGHKSWWREGGGSQQACVTWWISSLKLKDDTTASDKDGITETGFTFDLGQLRNKAWELASKQGKPCHGPYCLEKGPRQHAAVSLNWRGRAENVEYIDA